MQDNNRVPNSSMPDRLYGEHYPDSFLDMPGPLRATRYSPVDDRDRHVRKDDEQPKQPCVACQPNKSKQSCGPTPCLDCTSDTTCVCTTSNEQPGNKPSSESNNDGFADNIHYAHLDPTIPNGKEVNPSPWPCVVIGAKGRRDSAEEQSVSRSKDQPGATS